MAFLTMLPPAFAERIISRSEAKKLTFEALTAPSPTHHSWHHHAKDYGKSHTKNCNRVHWHSVHTVQITHAYKKDSIRSQEKNPERSRYIPTVRVNMLVSITKHKKIRRLQRLRTSYNIL